MCEIPKKKTRDISALYLTEDGGVTWRTLAEFAQGMMWGFSVINQQRVLVFGRAGALYRITRSDGHCERIATGTKLMIYDLSLRGLVGLLIGGGEVVSTRSTLILITNDGGDSWQRLPSPIAAVDMLSVHLTTWGKGVLATSQAIYSFQLSQYSVGEFGRGNKGHNLVNSAP